MTLSILGPSQLPRERPPERGPHTADLNTTTDLHEENTTDLAPATEDIEPSAAPSPEKRSLARSIAALSMSLPRMKPAAPEPPPRPLAKPALAPGMVLVDRYLLERVIGRGGTSVVFRARDMKSSSSSAPYAEVAVKTPKPDVEDKALAAQRLEHEYNHARQLSHPGVVRALDLHSDAERCFMTMELVEGKLLSEVLRERRSVRAPTALKILRSCADALGHAHGRGVVHGDFKPGNVFVLSDYSVKIVDFGAAIATPEVDPGSRVPAATAAYASPEVLAGQVPEIRDDVFSFACVAYELLAGEHPFEGKSSLEARAESRVPPRAWSLTAAQWLALLGALSWEREQRPSDVESLMTALTTQPEPVAEPSTPVSFAHAKRGLRPDLMPRQRTWGFYVFVACALAVTYLASQRATDSPEEAPIAAPAEAIAADPLGIVPEVSSASSLAGSPAPRSSASSIFTPEPEKAAPKPAASDTTVESSAAPKAAPAAPKPAPTSQISFETSSIVTSESSVAAVFLVKRSQPLTGRAKVQWKAVSGTADAGIDFASNASGTIEFADGQAQRAIYVPLRNDLLKESDETFSVRLQSPKQARLGEESVATATIRDDD
jgi:serine/threonine protein kinase